VESSTALVILMAAVFLMAGVLTTYAVSPNLWTPTPRPVIESVLLVGGDLLVDVRNPSNKVLRCQVYAGDRMLSGPEEILPGKIATYTGPATSRYVRVDCGEHAGRDVSLAYQVYDDGVTQAGGGQGGGQGGGGVGGGSSGSSDGGGEPRIRHFQCEVRSIGNRKVVRLHVNLQAVVNQGAKPYNFTIDFGDGSVVSEIVNSSAYTVSHLYDGRGPYTARLYVTDALGRQGYAELQIPQQCNNVGG